MDQRISRAAAVLTLVALPLLTGCGRGTSTPADSPVAPTSAQAPVLGATPAADPAASTTPSTGGDTDAQTEQIQAATRTFVKTVLTIGYPDKSFDDYTARIKPLMTEKGFASLESADSTRKGSAALTSLYAQHARSAPTFSADPTVTSQEGTRATAQLDYENVAQRKDGGQWKTLKSLGTGSATVKLVLQGGTWLVEDAS
jgi:hypothetical protein